MNLKIITSTNKIWTFSTKYQSLGIASNKTMAEDTIGELPVNHIKAEIVISVITSALN